MFEGVLNAPLLKNKAGVRCAKRTPTFSLVEVRFALSFWFFLVEGYLLPLIFKLI